MNISRSRIPSVRLLQYCCIWLLCAYKCIFWAKICKNTKFTYWVIIGNFCWIWWTMLFWVWGIIIWAKNANLLKIPYYHSSLLTNLLPDVSILNYWQLLLSYVSGAILWAQMCNNTKFGYWVIIEYSVNCLSYRDVWPLVSFRMMFSITRLSHLTFDLDLKVKVKKIWIFKIAKYLNSVRFQRSQKLSMNFA